jgi:hypothetical protein
MHPLGYFASAPDGTPDAAILVAVTNIYKYLDRLGSGWIYGGLAIAGCDRPYLTYTPKLLLR